MPRMIAMIASGNTFKNVGYKHSRFLLLSCYYSYITDISQFLNVGIFNFGCDKTWYIATMKKVKQHPYGFDMVFCMLHLALYLSHRWAANQGSH